MTPDKPREWNFTKTSDGAFILGSTVFADSLKPGESISLREVLPQAQDEKRHNWNEFHGCFTGDCPHDDVNDCITSLREAARESDFAQPQAEPQFDEKAASKVADERIEDYINESKQCCDQCHWKAKDCQGWIRSFYMVGARWGYQEAINQMKARGEK